MINIKNALFIVVLFAIGVFAHEFENSESLHMKGYDVSFFKPEYLKINSDLKFSVKIIDSDGNPFSEIDVQGQILDSSVGREIFYAKVLEESPALYSFSWAPSSAGDYVVQFIFRSSDGEVLQPSFLVDVVDPRSGYAFILGAVLASLSIIIGFSLLFSKKDRFKRFFLAFIVGLIFFGLGYSVSYFYEKGGESGFVVCGTDGCELAVHWHSQLEMSVCKESFNLPLESGDLSRQHTHKERNRLHFHSTIKTSDESGSELLEPEKLRLGDLFDQLGIRFSKGCFSDYCNGDKCPSGDAGNLQVIVNGVHNEQYSEYVWKDGDKIQIMFG